MIIEMAMKWDGMGRAFRRDSLGINDIGFWELGIPLMFGQGFKDMRSDI